ncbi:MAG: O-antigen ligase family protein, partial [Clostridia bacterium]
MKEKLNKILENIKNSITMENLLCFFIIICPILDISSFIFRNYFNTSISISTFIRPIIPIIAIIYIFFKDKIKPQLFITVGVYGVYAICHLYIFHRIKTGCAYGNELRELQYLINYTFMIMNLFIYIYFFGLKRPERKTNINKLKIAVLISLTIYISLMYISLITGTSSFTYTEDKVGYKGWFESGNSIGTIMLLSLFITLPLIGKKNPTGVRVWSFMVTVLVGAYLTTLLGTRTGLFGFAVAILAYLVLSILYGIIHNKNINKKILTSGIIAFSIIEIAVIIFGSKTLERRKQLQNREDAIYDTMTQQTAHVTGDIVKLVEQIKAGTLDTEY